LFFFEFFLFLFLLSSYFFVTEDFFIGRDVCVCGLVRD
jgi:hypothetical protein